METEHNHKWQRRILDRPSDDDYTSKALGEEVVTETTKVVECPGCKRPGVPFGLKTEYGQAVMMVHKRQKGGQPTEICVATTADRPDLVILDSDGNEEYAGPVEIPEEYKN
jgi:hypothetical protein